MLRDPKKDAAAQLKRVKRELETVRRLTRNELATTTPESTRWRKASEVLIYSEVTFLLRLFAAFESGLVLIAATLRTPRLYTTNDTLGQILDQLGKDSNLPIQFRSTVDQDLRAYRNELMHGRSHIPRLPFDATMELMQRFTRGLV